MLFGSRSSLRYLVVTVAAMKFLTAMQVMEITHHVEFKI
jgi:hypothetical protein